MSVKFPGQNETLVKTSSEFPGPCCHPCSNPRPKMGIFKILRLFVVIIVLTVIFISWSYAINMSVRQIFGLGETIKDVYLVAIISSILGIALLKIFNVKVEDAIDMDI